MQFDQTLSTANTEVSHDPEGQDIQAHELPSGEVLLTFSDLWCVEQDYRLGDTIKFVIDEENGKLDLINLTRQERSSHVK